MNNVLRIILLFLLIFSIDAKAQCPTQLNETRDFDLEAPLIYLALDSNLINEGTGAYSVELIGGKYVKSDRNWGVEFDGVDDYIKLSPTIGNLQDFTITMWITPYNQEEAMGLLSVREQCVGDYRGYSMIHLNINEYEVSGLNYQVNSHQNCSGWSGGDRYINSLIDLPNNSPSFIALTVQQNDDKSRVVNLFVDCEAYPTEQILNLADAAVFSASRNYTTTIGASSTVSEFINSFDGIIDEIRVYDSVLNHEELSEFFQDKPLDISMEAYGNCGIDSTRICINNPDLNVDYFLKDKNTNEQLDVQPQLMCDPICFLVGQVDTDQTIQIEAISQTNDCSLILDTTLLIQQNRNAIENVDTTFICQGDSVLFGNEYIKTNSVKRDTIKNESECDSININYFNLIEPPVVSLGEDASICQLETLILDAYTSEGNTYRWQDGSTQSSYEVVEAGIYSVRVENACGLTSSDTLLIAPCCEVLVPNVFSPNADNLNDRFHPITTCHFTNYQMSIYNRWGELVFETTDRQETWDGTFKDEALPMGVYVYVIEYTDHQISNQLKGDILLLR